MRVPGVITIILCLQFVVLFFLRCLLEKTKLLELSLKFPFADQPPNAVFLSPPGVTITHTKEHEWRSVLTQSIFFSSLWRQAFEMSWMGPERRMYCWQGLDAWQLCQKLPCLWWVIYAWNKWTRRQRVQMNAQVACKNKKCLLERSAFIVNTCSWSHI